MLKDTADFAESVEHMMKKTLGISLAEQVCRDTFIYFFIGIYNLGNPLWQCHCVECFIKVESQSERRSEFL